MEFQIFRQHQPLTTESWQSGKISNILFGTCTDLNYPHLTSLPVPKLPSALRLAVSGPWDSTSSSNGGRARVAFGVPTSDQHHSCVDQFGDR